MSLMSDVRLLPSVPMLAIVCLSTWILTLSLTISNVAAMPNYAFACDRREVQTSCLYGCLGCLEAYGPRMYNMAACCHDCKTSKAMLIDDGPIKCSGRYIHITWLKRFGKRQEEEDSAEDNMAYGQETDNLDSVFVGDVYK